MMGQTFKQIGLGFGGSGEVRLQQQHLIGSSITSSFVTQTVLTITLQQPSRFRTGFREDR
jgi:hypothetical protein